MFSTINSTIAIILTVAEITRLLLIISRFGIIISVITIIMISNETPFFTSEALFFGSGALCLPAEESSYTLDPTPYILNSRPT